MRGWNDGTRQASDLAAFGLQLVDSPSDGVLPLWPDNEPIVALFGRAMTQWSYAGLGAPVGLRYETLPFLLRLQGIPRSEWAEVFDWLQVMELRAVAVMNEKEG